MNQATPGRLNRPTPVRGARWHRGRFAAVSRAA